MSVLIIFGLTLGIGMILLSMVMIPYVIYRQKTRYNNGICPICGEKLELFDYDSHGARGYCCPCTKQNHSYYSVWVEYNFIDRKFNN